MQMITSKDNAKLKAVRALIRSRKERQATSCFVIEGVRALSALADGTALPQYTLKEVWVSLESSALADAFNVPVFSIPHEFMEQISDCHSSQGILGVVEYTAVPLEIAPEQGSYLLLDCVMDPGNMGTLIRSAVAFGFEAVFLYGDCVDVFNPKTVRATMGALPFSNIWKIDDNVFGCLEKAGYDLVSTAMEGGDNLKEMTFGPKNVLVIGNEAKGISDEVFRRATRRLSIPMSGNVESLNAGVAGSLCMFLISSR